MADKRVFSVLPFALLAGGCAIHPLPIDVTRYSTYDIVAQIRCEAREAASEMTIGLLLAGKTEATIALGKDLLQTAKNKRFERYRKIYKTGYRDIDAETKLYFAKYDDTAIAYDFTFDIKEQNKSEISAGFTDPFSNGILNLGMGASNDRTRNNLRNFRMSDKFRDLLIKIPDEYCSGEMPGRNWQYPIVGQVGVVDVVRTFIQLNEVGSIITEKDRVPTLADTLEFETTISGNINPVLQIIPLGGNIGRALRLGDASFKETAMRHDRHRVQLVISLPPETAATSKADGKTRQPVLPRTPARAGASPGEIRALQELDRQDDKILSRRLERLIR